MSLLPTKNVEMDAKHYILGNKRTLRNLENECFIVSQEPKGNKRKNLCIWRSFLDTKMLKVMNNTLN